MSTSTTQKNMHARRLFDGIARDYERPAQLFSLFQYRRWRRYLVSRLALPPEALVLDVCTGPGGVAVQIVTDKGCRTVGIDLSPLMVREARRTIESHNLTSMMDVVRGRAEDLPFASNSFDAVVFTFLLRYVEDTRATLGELVRVLRPGGQLASLEFYVPSGPVLHPLWLAHTRLAMPLGTRFMGPGWGAVGSFLGPSISRFYRQHSLKGLENEWTEAGIFQVETRLLSAGGAVVMHGQKR